MRYWSIVLLLLWPSVTSAEDEYAVRVLDPLAATMLGQAVERSAIVRDLVDQLRHSNLIVHIAATRNLPSGIGGTTRFVASRGEHRYLRISLSASLPPADRVAIVGHELQHALEVAQSLAANAAEVRQWFETSGFRAGISDDLFETNAALQIERHIRQELRAGHASARAR
jgi:hypothetical protein